jgi:hypothetical protein
MTSDTSRNIMHAYTSGISLRAFLQILYSYPFKKFKPQENRQDKAILILQNNLYNHHII